MPGKTTSTRSSAKATAPKRVAKNISVSIQAPGNVPEKVSVPVGSDVANLRSIRNMDEGYVLTVNGEEVSNSYILQKGDAIRIGLKLKNGK